ncbi:hypothetical protein A2379_04895 [Candidatus Amesbacteria bacterium RIFOXYB1_FULL_47_13]|nr:MAG: hypothetical protein A2379_04895 [Candidatus Amesbacteria bacterium RIFOXYB1_FULL_47_13]
MIIKNPPYWGILDRSLPAKRDYSGSKQQQFIYILPASPPETDKTSATVKLSPASPEKVFRPPVPPRGRFGLLLPGWLILLNSSHN